MHHIRRTLSLLVLITAAAFQGLAGAETLTVQFTPTQPVSGTYGSRHVIAVWVETSTGAFVKTIGDWSAARRSSLDQWQVKAGTSDTDAIMGATQTSFTTKSITWDMSQKSGGTAPDGTYKVWFETVNKDNPGAGTTSANGVNRTNVSFTKNGTASTVGPVTQDRYTSITLTYTGRTVAPPVFTTHPANQTVTLGQTATFTIVATGATSYQWQVSANGTSGWANVTSGTNATTASYTTAATTLADHGRYYRCNATNGGGTTSSNSATLTVNAAAPSITGQPTPQSVATGATATFAVTATSSVAMTYQWKVSTTGVGGTYNNVTGGTGATTASYTTAATVIGDNGRYYRCVVTNSSNGNLATTSGTALLTVSNVVVPPAITAQPASIARLDGQNAAFTVTATGSPLYYQWKRNGTAITGATTSSYSFTCAMANNGDSFTCTVSNAAGANPVTSNAAILTVTAAPPAIATQPVNRTVGAGATATFTVTATGTATLHYQWTRTDAGGTTNVGTDANSYNITAQAADDGAQFACAVSNTAGSVTSSSATLTVIPLPQITAQPADAQAAVGADAIFTITATGAGLTYQWRRNGTAIAGATGTTCTLTAALANDGDVFTCVVTNAAGAVTSAGATLTVYTLPAITSQPLGLIADSGTAVTFTVAATGTGPLAYQWQKDGLDLTGATAATFTIAAATMADVGDYVCVVSNAYGSVVSATAALAVNAPAAPFVLTFRTSPAGGPYAPTNVVAVWIEKADGTFVRTLGNWSGERRGSLTAWGSAAGAGDVDAVMGATRSDHGATLTVTWDLLPRGGGAPVADGDYVVRFEVVDANAGASGVRPTTTFTVAGGAVAPAGPLSLNGVTQVTINNANAVAQAPLEEPGGCGLGSAYALAGLFLLLALRWSRLR